MKNTIFDYHNYKSYVHALIASYPNGGRGQRKALANAIDCQVAYITHVLSGHNHFSLEQAEGVARYFSLTREETEFFLLIVQHNRAGTSSLKKFFEQSIEEKREKNKLLKSRLKIKDTLPREDQTTYYGSWQFAAVHILLTIPHFGSPEVIAEKLRLSPSRVREILEFLCSRGLARKEFNQYKTDAPVLHLEKDSPLILKHHTNWRLRALQAIEETRDEDLHYSLAFSVSEKDLPKIREILAQAIESCAKVIRPSKEETLASLCIDLFRV